MRKLACALAAAGLAALAACNDTPAENAAENVEAAADNEADLLEEMADNATTDAAEDNFQNAAENVEEAGENAADAIESNASGQ